MVQNSKLSPWMLFFFSRLFPLPFVLIGALALFFGMRGVYRARESTKWPVAEGTIQNASVEYHSGSKGGGTYHAEILYQFTEGGETRSGNTVAFGDFGSSRPSHAQRIVNRYPKGKAVKVYYRADDADTCVLEPGVHGQAWALPGFGFVFLVAGSAMMVLMPRVIRKFGMLAESQPGTPRG